MKNINIERLKRRRKLKSFCKQTDSHNRGLTASNLCSFLLGVYIASSLIPDRQPTDTTKEDKTEGAHSTAKKYLFTGKSKPL